MSTLKYRKPSIADDVWRFGFDDLSGEILTLFFTDKDFMRRVFRRRQHWRWRDCSMYDV